MHFFAEEGFEGFGNRPLVHIFEIERNNAVFFPKRGYHFHQHAVQMTVPFGQFGVRQAEHLVVIREFFLSFLVPKE